MSCFGHPCFPIIRKCVTIGLYKADVGTDIYSAVQYLEQGHEWWGYLTVTFTVCPMFLIAITLCLIAFINQKWCKAFLSIICFPLVPLGVLYWNLIESIRECRRDDRNSNVESNDNNINASDDDPEHVIVAGSNINGDSNTISNDNNSNASDDDPDHVMAAGGVKLSESLTESLPQSAIAMHIIFQTLEKDGWEGVAYFQWITLTVSLVALSFSIASNEYIFYKEDTACDKAWVFMLTLPAVTCRLMVCCTYSAIHPGYWFIPIGTELALWIIIGIITKCSNHDLFKWKSVMAVTSSVYIWYAIGGFFIALPMPITITSLVLNIGMAPIQIIAWMGIIE